MFAFELVGGLAANSLALVADAGHLLTDLAGIGLTLVAIWFAGRPANRNRSFGLLRLEILAAIVNAMLLFGDRRVRAGRGVAALERAAGGRARG